MFSSEEEAAAFKSAIFLTSIGEVGRLVLSHLKDVADEFEAHSCEPVIHGPEGKRSVLGGVVKLSQSSTYSDGKYGNRQELVLQLGHAALGQQTATRTVASVRKELLKRLSQASPAGAVTEAGCSFTMRLSDGELTLTSMSGFGNSIVQAVVHSSRETLRAM